MAESDLIATAYALLDDKPPEIQPTRVLAPLAALFSLADRPWKLMASLKHHNSVDQE